MIKTLQKKDETKKKTYVYHPFIDGIFHEINHPAIGVPPFMETAVPQAAVRSSHRLTERSFLCPACGCMARRDVFGRM
jgi:hypothetical protein